MANQEQLEILKQGVEAWNKWRDENMGIDVDLKEAYLWETNLSQANLCRANLNGASLWDTNLSRANLREANLREASLDNADLTQSNLIEANLRAAHLWTAKLIRADLRDANLQEAALVGADLREADLRGAHLNSANFYRAILSDANLSGADLSKADFWEADLRGADLSGTFLNKAKLREANLSLAKLTRTDLSQADLRQANLSRSDLRQASLVQTIIDKAKISGSAVYGINVWDLKGEFEEQSDLRITYKGDSVITVDNIKIAQFIYLILNNGEIRDVINTLTSKSVLILCRFAIPERKAILDTLRNKLRGYNLLPIVFDFDRPTDKDFTETIKTLAGLCYFVIADVTNPKSSPLELQATVPDYQIPFVPIIQEGESPFAMMVDLQKKYNWVLNTVTYDSADTLMKILKPLIIDPAMKKRQELRIIKAQVPEVISGKDFLDKGIE